MVPSENQSDRDFYLDQFNRLFMRLDKLDSIEKQIREIQENDILRHSHDEEVLKMFHGNGKPALAIRLDRLENQEPIKEKRTSWWFSVAALTTSGLLVVVDAIAAYFRK